MVGATVCFTFDELWDNLSRVAVFRCGSEIRDVIGAQEAVKIPPEVLLPDGELFIGIEGRDKDGSMVIPTVWVRAAYVYPGANVSGDTSTNPELPVWAQTAVTAAAEQGLTLDPTAAVTRSDAAMLLYEVSRMSQAISK
jgi:hypothetical protein